jgi:hypothetical protein
VVTKETKETETMIPETLETKTLELETKTLNRIDAAKSDTESADELETKREHA